MPESRTRKTNHHDETAKVLPMPIVKPPLHDFHADRKRHARWVAIGILLIVLGLGALVGIALEMLP